MPKALKSITVVYDDGKPQYGPVKLPDPDGFSETDIVLAKAEPGDEIELPSGSYRVDSVTTAEFRDYVEKILYLQKTGTDADGLFEKLKEKAIDIIDRDMADIDLMEAEPGENEYSLNIRKQHYRAEARAIRQRILSELHATP